MPTADPHGEMEAHHAAGVDPEWRCAGAVLCLRQTSALPSMSRRCASSPAASSALTI